MHVGGAQSGANRWKSENGMKVVRWKSENDSVLAKVILSVESVQNMESQNVEYAKNNLISSTENICKHRTVFRILNATQYPDLKHTYM